MRHVQTGVALSQVQDPPDAKRDAGTADSPASSEAAPPHLRVLGSPFVALCYSGATKLTHLLKLIFLEFPLWLSSLRT